MSSGVTDTDSHGHPPDKGGSAPLTCPYCRSALPMSFRPNAGLHRCPKCRRYILLNDRVAKLLEGGRHAMIASAVPLDIGGPPAVVLTLVACATGKSLLTLPMLLWLVVLGAYWAHDGYLSIVTRIRSDFVGRVVYGDEAVRDGIAWFTVGLGGVAMMSFAVIAVCIRSLG